MKFIVRIFLLILLTLPSFAEEYLYILNDSCILDLYSHASDFFKDTPILVVKDPHGLLLRFEIKDIKNDCKILSSDTYKKVKYVEQFLAKMNNPAIIEVHINEIPEECAKRRKKWEISTLIANNIESVILLPKGKLARDKIHSVGFGEFLPPKNTSNNGGNYVNRVDIMILCDINGE